MKMKNKVLAVLALALLMINILPVRVAEAAVSDVWATINGVAMPDIRSFDWSNYTDLFAEEYGYEGNIGEKIIREHKYCIIMASPGAVDAGYTGYLKFLFTNEPVQYTEHEFFWLFADWTTDVYFELENGRATTMKGYGQNRYYVGNGVYDDLIRVPIYSDNQSCRVWCANYDFAAAYPDDYRYDYYYIDYPEPEPVYDYTYSSTGPVAATWSAGISRLMQYMPVDADDLEDFYVKSNWEAQYDRWKYSIIYRVKGDLPALAGSSPTDGSMYKLHTESVIAFPSKELVIGWISSGMSPVELYFDKGITNWHQTVYEGQDTFFKVKVTNESVPFYHSLMNGSHAFQVDIPMTDIIAAVDESLDGGLRGYYGLSQEMWELWKNSIYSYKLPLEIYTVLYAKEDVDTMIYGNMHYSVPNWTDVDHLLKGYVFTGGVIEKPLEDITENDKQEMQIDTTKAELAKRTEELEQLKKEYAESLKMNGSDEDVFELFSNFTSGLRSSSGSFKNVATAVGNVFAFFPEDITGLLYGGIIVMIVIAVYKALRG